MILIFATFQLSCCSCIYAAAKTLYSHIEQVCRGNKAGEGLCCKCAIHNIITQKDRYRLPFVQSVNSAQHLTSYKGGKIHPRITDDSEQPSVPHKELKEHEIQTQVIEAWLYNYALVSCSGASVSLFAPGQFVIQQELPE